MNYVDPSGLLSIGDVWDAAVTKPMEWASEKIGQGADQVGITDLAEDAASYYADVTNDPNAGWLANAGAWTGGLLSSLATRDNIGDTTLTLAGGFGGGGCAGGARYSIKYHRKVHPFRLVGRRHHIQLLRYIKGKSNSDKRMQIPLP